MRFLIFLLLFSPAGFAKYQSPMAYNPGNNKLSMNATESEWLSYCSTEKRELCKWTTNIAIAREAARLHQTEYREHHIELWERAVINPASIHLRRAIKITKWVPPITSKIRHS